MKMKTKLSKFAGYSEISVQRKQCITMNTYIRKEARPRINNLSFRLRKLREKIRTDKIYGKQEEKINQRRNP